MPTHIVTMPYFKLAAVQRMHHGGRADRAGGTQRVGRQRDGAAHRLDPAAEPAGLDHRQGLCGEGFVQPIQPRSSSFSPA